MSVFISYSSADVENVEKICSFLENNEIKCWIAPRDIKPGLNYPAQIIGAKRSCSGLILLASDEPKYFEHVNNEAEHDFEYINIMTIFYIF